MDIQVSTIDSDRAPCVVRSSAAMVYMMTSSNGNIFRVTGPLCGEFTGPGEFPAQGPVTRSFDVFFHLRLNKRLSKQPWGWWFETPAWSSWRHRNGLCRINMLLSSVRKDFNTWAISMLIFFCRLKTLSVTTIRYLECHARCRSVSFTEEDCHHTYIS